MTTDKGQPMKRRAWWLLLALQLVLTGTVVYWMVSDGKPAVEWEVPRLGR